MVICSRRINNSVIHERMGNLTENRNEYGIVKIRSDFASRFKWWKERVLAKTFPRNLIDAFTSA